MPPMIIKNVCLFAGCGVVFLLGGGCNFKPYVISEDTRDKNVSPRIENEYGADHGEGQNCSSDGVGRKGANVWVCCGGGVKGGGQIPQQQCEATRCLLPTNPGFFVHLFICFQAPCGKIFIVI